jgi:tetratricopeptide (TPR) repeat protein
MTLPNGLKPPQTERRPHPLEANARRTLLKKRVDGDTADLFVTDPNAEIAEVGRLALRQPDDVNYAFWLGDLCAQRSFSGDQRLRIFYVGKTLMAYQRALRQASTDIDRAAAQRAIDDYGRWVVRRAIANPTQRNLSVALWAVAYDEDDAMPRVNIAATLTQELLNMFMKPPLDATQVDEGSATVLSTDLLTDGGSKTMAENAAADYSDASATQWGNEIPLSESIVVSSPVMDDATQGDAAEPVLESLVEEPSVPSEPMRPAARRDYSHETDYRIGDLIEDRYEVSDIKLGGMGVVYLCYDHELRAPIAIKSFQRRFMDNERAIARFEQEALTWIRLEKHLHIVQAKLVQKIQNRPYILLEHISATEGIGVDLRSWIEHNRLTPRDTMLFAIHVALGMQHATSRIPGLVHRDLKPGNVLVTHDGIAKITDFGLVRSLEGGDTGLLTPDSEREITSQRLTRAHAMVGTPPYMSPEQFSQRDVDQRADIYSFGCMLYEMLVGRPPFRGKTMPEWKQAHTTENVSFPPTVQHSHCQPLLEMTLRCLEKNPDGRPQTWLELVEGLSEIYWQEFGKLPNLALDGVALEARELIDKGYSLTELGRYEEALEAYDRAIELQGENSWFWARKGRTLRLLNRYEESMQCYEKALEIQPDYPWAWNGKGIIHDRLGQLDEALAAFHRASELNPNDVWTWYNIGDALHRKGDHEKAALMLEKAVEIDRNNAHSLAKLGKVRRAMQQPQQAIEAYRAAIAIQNDYAWAYNGLGLSYKSINRLDEAIIAFKQATHYQPDVVWHWYNLAETLVAMGRYADALQPAQEATRVDPQNSPAWGKLGQVLRYLKRYEDALNAYNRAIELDHFFDWAINGKGMVLENMGRYQDAYEAYVDATRLNPERDWHWYNQANALYLMKRYDEAHVALDEALRLNPAFTKALALKGSIYRQQGNTQAALETLLAATRMDDNQSWAWNELGVTYEALQQYTEAQAAYRRAALQDPQNLNYQYKQAEMLVATDHLGEALALLEHILRLNDRSASIWAKHAQVLRRLERYEEALNSYTRALNLDPQYSWAWIGKGLTLGSMRRGEEALECFRQAIAIDRSDLWAWYSSGDELLNLNRITEAIAAFSEAIRLDPNHAESWTKLAQAFRTSGRYVEAIDAYNKAIDLRPGNAWAWNGRGQALKELGRREEALVNYQRAIELDSSVSWFYINLMTLQLDTGRKQEALETIDQAAGVEPGNPTIWARRGQVLRRLNRYDEALESYDTALALDDEYAWAWNGKGLCLIQLRRYDEALACYQRAVHFDPQAVWFWYNYGEALMQAGQLQEAREAMEQALMVDPSHLLSKEKLANLRRELDEE